MMMIINSRHICRLLCFTCESCCVSQVHQKKFMHYIRAGNATKVSNALAKGMDPNFQDPDTKGT